MCSTTTRILVWENLNSSFYSSRHVGSLFSNYWECSGCFYLWVNLVFTQVSPTPPVVSIPSLVPSFTFWDLAVLNTGLVNFVSVNLTKLTITILTHKKCTCNKDFLSYIILIPKQESIKCWVFFLHEIQGKELLSSTSRTSKEQVCTRW